MTQRAAIYLRQSLDRQEGIDRQRVRTRDLATLRGWTVVEEYQDNDVSASKQRGPQTAWAKLLQDAQAGRIDVVISVDLDRLLRGTRDLVTLIDSGLKVVTVDGELDLATADGEFRATMLAGIARFETRRKSERQLRANADRASRGKINPGRRKFGYERGNLRAMESEAQWVRWLFDQAKAGASIRSMYLHLKRENVSVGGGVEWTTRRVRDTLMSRAYEGMTVYRGTWSPSEDVERIISPELAAEVRAILSDPRRRTSVDNVTKHLLSGIAACGVCGRTLVVMKDYRCKDQHVSIQTKLLNGAVLKAVVDAILFAPKDEAQSSPATDASIQLLSIREARSDLLTLVSEGVVDLADVGTQLRDLKAREASLIETEDHQRREAAGADLRAQHRTLFTRGAVALSDAVEAKQQLRETFRGLALEKQRELVRTHLRITVMNGRGTERVHIEHLSAISLNS